MFQHLCEVRLQAQAVQVFAQLLLQDMDALQSGGVKCGTCEGVQGNNGMLPAVARD